MDFDLEQAIDAFCSRISVARSQDDAIRQEVASHLRAKVDYYLNKRQLTEQEAFVLASQTMGDPNQFAVEMRGVHRTERVAGQAFSLLSVFGMMMFIHGISKVLFFWEHSFLLTPELRDKDPEYVFVPILQLISYAIPISVVWLFGKIVKGYGTGTLAEWVRKNASLVTVLSLLITFGLYSWILVSSNTGVGHPAISHQNSFVPSATSHVTFAVNPLIPPIFYYRVITAIQGIYLGVLTYLTCWLYSYVNKGVFDNLKVAALPFVCIAFYWSIGSILLHPQYAVGVTPHSYEVSLLYSSGYGLTCLVGWMTYKSTYAPSVTHLP